MSSEAKTKVELLIEADGYIVTLYNIERYNDRVLGEFVGSDAGRNRGSWVETDGSAVTITFCGRVGGGNREDWNHVWRDAYRHDWLVTVRDGEFDATYAYFVFAVPPDRIEELWTLTPKREALEASHEQ